jgi:hypothetical protein
VASLVEVAATDQATPADIKDARASAAGEEFYLMVDHQASATYRPDGSESSLPFQDHEENVGRAKASQDALYEAAHASGPLHCVMWERLPYTNVPSMGGSRRKERCFQVFAGARRRSYWGEFSSSQVWLRPEGTKKVSIDPSDQEAVSSERWSQHSALYYRPLLERSLGSSLSPELLPEGFDSCPNCAASLVGVAQYLESGGSPSCVLEDLPAALEEIPLVTRAGELLKAVTACLDRPTLVEHPKKEVSATDAKPTIHGLVCDMPYARGLQEPIMKYGAPVKALSDAIARESRHGRRRYR